MGSSGRGRYGGIVVGAGGTAAAGGAEEVEVVWTVMEDVEGSEGGA